MPPQESDYTHYAFTVAKDDFALLSRRLEQAGVTVWKQNKSEEHRSIFSTRTAEAQAGAACRQSCRAAGCVSGETVCGDGLLSAKGS